ncbi:hypothetical protein ACFSUK_35645 [Sphingobium scionense]
MIHWEEWLAAASTAEPDPNVAPLPHLHYTSGTTGRPKATETPPQYFPRVATVQALAETVRARITPRPASPSARSTIPARSAWPATSSAA